VIVTLSKLLEEYTCSWLSSPIYTIQPVLKSVVKPVWQTGWTTGCIVYTNIQPVVKPVVQPVHSPVWQPVVSCKRGIRLLWHGLCCGCACSAWEQHQHGEQRHRRAGQSHWYLWSPYGI